MNESNFLNCLTIIMFNLEQCLHMEKNSCCFDGHVGSKQVKQQVTWWKVSLVILKALERYLSLAVSSMEGIQGYFLWIAFLMSCSVGGLVRLLEIKVPRNLKSWTLSIESPLMTERASALHDVYDLFCFLLQDCLLNTT